MRRVNSATPVHSWLNRQTLTDFHAFCVNSTMSKTSPRCWRYREQCSNVDFKCKDFNCKPRSRVYILAEF